MQKSALDMLWKKHNLHMVTINNYNEINKTMLNKRYKLYINKTTLFNPIT